MPSTNKNHPGLHELYRADLAPSVQARFERIMEPAVGSPTWLARKTAEVRELLALAQIAPRLRVQRLDARWDLLAEVRLDAVLPTRAGPGEPVVLEKKAVLVILYPERVLYSAVPGHALVQIRSPRGVFLPNASAGAGSQHVCLGLKLPVAIPLREIVLRTYAALTLQAVMLDPRDAAGVLNRQAAAYWLANRDRMPLSSAPFLAAVDPGGAS